MDCFTVMTYNTVTTWLTCKQITYLIMLMCPRNSVIISFLGFVICVWAYSKNEYRYKTYANWVSQHKYTLCTYTLYITDEFRRICMLHFRDWWDNSSTYSTGRGSLHPVAFSSSGFSLHCKSVLYCFQMFIAGRIRYILNAMLIIWCADECSYADDHVKYAYSDHPFVSFMLLYIFLSQQVLYFLLSTLVLTLYIDVVLSLSISMG